MAEFDYDLEDREFDIISDVLRKYNLNRLSKYLKKCMHNIIFDYKREKDINFEFVEVRNYIDKKYDKQLRKNLIKLIENYAIHFRTCPALSENKKKVEYRVYSDIYDREIKYQDERDNLRILINGLKEDINNANDEIHKQLEILWRDYRKKYYGDGV